MRHTWLFCLCVFLAVSPPQVLLIDNFESPGNWESISSEGCTIRMFEDQYNAREGQKSLAIEAEFTDACQQEQCYAGIMREAPDLREYAFFRFWLRPSSAVDATFGIYLRATGERDYIHTVPLNRTGWHVVTAHFSDFKSEDQSEELLPEDIVSIAFFIMSKKAVKVQVNVDDFVALTDVNNNRIPDIDEAEKEEAAANSEEIADRYFDNGDYEKAAKYYDEAKSLYDQAGMTEKSKEMEQKKLESVSLQDFEDAEESYAQEKYLEAQQAYERARRGFVKLGDPDMVDQIEERLEELSKLTGRPVSPLPQSYPSTQQPRPNQSGNQGGGRLLFVLILVFLVGVGVYFFKFREPSKPKPKSEEPESKTGPARPLEPVTPSEARSEEIRELKAKFVYGEISRKEYEEKLRELEGEIE
jgi:tetratricopeptide (TPR) repeat protein